MHLGRVTKLLPERTNDDKFGKHLKIMGRSSSIRPQFSRFND
jgi:hypothetical protein